MNKTRTILSSRFVPAFLIVLGFGNFAKADLITADMPLTGRWVDPKNPGEVIVFKAPTGSNGRGEPTGRFYIPGTGSGQYTYVGDSISGKVILESPNGTGGVTVTKMAAVPVGQTQLKLTRFGTGSSALMDRVPTAATGGSGAAAGSGVLAGVGGGSPYTSPSGYGSGSTGGVYLSPGRYTTGGSGYGSGGFYRPIPGYPTVAYGFPAGMSGYRPQPPRLALRVGGIGIQLR